MVVPKTAPTRNRTLLLKVAQIATTTRYMTSVLKVVQLTERKTESEAC